MEKQDSLGTHTQMDLERLLEMTVQEDVEPSNRIEMTPMQLELGSALKRTSDGTVLTPKVIIRAPKAKVGDFPHVYTVMLIC
jgi:hypothetical protein